MFFAPSKTRQRAKIPSMGVSKTSDHIQINIRMPNPSQEPPASSKAPNEDLKDMDVLCTFKIKIESKNLEHGYIKDQGPYQNLDQDAKIPVRNLQRPPKSQMRTYRTWMFFAPSKSRQEAKIQIMGISKTSDHFQTRSRCQTPVINLQHPPRPQMRT